MRFLFFKVFSGSVGIKYPFLLGGGGVAYVFQLTKTRKGRTGKLVAPYFRVARFGSVPVRASVPEKRFRHEERTVPTVPVSGSGPVPRPPWYFAICDPVSCETVAETPYSAIPRDT